MASLSGTGKGNGNGGRTQSKPSTVTRQPPNQIYGFSRLSLAQLIQNTPDNILKNAENQKCRANFFGEYTKPNGIKVYTYRCGCSGRPHLTLVEVLPNSDPSKDAVRVQCTCEYFIYTLEVVLADSGMAENRYALPQWPIVKNPNGSKHGCKHLALVANDVIIRSRQGIEDSELSRMQMESAIENSHDVARKMARY